MDCAPHMTYSHILSARRRQSSAQAESSASRLSRSERRELRRAALKRLAGRGYLETTVEDITEATDEGKALF